MSKELREMYDVILDRKENREEGSYTNYLFDKGCEKICKKIGEEATEVVIAAMKDDKEELIGEINDVLYHTLVLMAAKGITLEDVNEEIAKRNLKTGNFKGERKAIDNV